MTSDISLSSGRPAAPQIPPAPVVPVALSPFVPGVARTPARYTISFLAPPAEQIMEEAAEEAVDDFIEEIVDEISDVPLRSQMRMVACGVDNGQNAFFLLPWC
jgi:hypothetical protein